METEENVYMLSETSGDNFSQYLYDIYEKEIRFKISDEDVVNIETGIASMVQEIANYVNEHCDKDRLLYRFSEKFPELTLVKHCKTQVIKVGSFYENTKTGFPDEFDFLFPIFTFESDLRYDIKYRYGGLMYSINYLHDIHDALYNCSKVMKKNKIKYQFCNNTILFKGFAGRRGPSSKLKFIYKANTTDAIVINVDLVPCLKITFNPPKKFEKFSLICKDFERHVMATGSYVIVGSIHSVSFAETEVRFMKEVLSEKHRKVYMLLKHLINGHGDNEVLRTEFDTKGVCSYYIKCAMIYHHFECDGQNENDEASCVIAVLRKLKTGLDKFEVTLLTYVVKYVSKSTAIAFKQLLEHIEGMRKSKNSDEKLFLESAAKTQFKDEVLTRNFSRVCNCIRCTPLVENCSWNVFALCGFIIGCGVFVGILQCILISSVDW